ncbi:ImmA/IrrE family metallo-endopeptidase [Heliorestis convoluta]|uniref:ImmA/IrrE family metallo-endopeptidase n=1 Tax=Heliorestis convoluta TaxID=356322 RepID=A0A5Q2N4Z2_9FIRM|nr:ImmA/IrrE family metallo-endopeptidase [Heliorestis convoluta]QGG47320.1 ImmA/IrrE family metallo-endopeptidase [Heliorestis convoluta]
MIANYKNAVIESAETLKDYSINQTPIDLDIILDALKRTIRLFSYSDFSTKNDMSIVEICDQFDSELGACVYDKKTERYVIFYNDTKNNRGLERFTIAHELGHIFLGHHQDANTDILIRRNISASKYRKFENEANCFARNLLAPIPLVQRITDIKKPRSANDIMEAFEVSYKAAVTRRNLYYDDKAMIEDKYHNYFDTYSILYGHYCLTCNNAEIDSNGYCKICGEEAAIFEKSCDRVYYDGVTVDQDGRAVECPRCGNEVFSDEARYCKICGALVVNYCLGRSMPVPFIKDLISHPINDGNARYCKECGSKTAFYKQGFLKSWNGTVDVGKGQYYKSTDQLNQFGKVAESRSGFLKSKAK